MVLYYTSHSQSISCLARSLELEDRHAECRECVREFAVRNRDGLVLRDDEIGVLECVRGSRIRAAEYRSDTLIALDREVERDGGRDRCVASIRDLGGKGQPDVCGQKGQGQRLP
jgi:hypothetical protein